MLRVGETLPTFSLQDQTGNTISSETLKGKWSVIYFYPKDNTPGCTTEACSFRDAYSDFRKNGIVVIGVSKDSVVSHGKFVDKFQLPFILLADPELELIKTFGVWAKKKFMGREYDGILRTTFLINPKGEIVKVYENVKPADHAKMILHDWQMLQ